jgi:hypothetical protein
MPVFNSDARGAWERADADLYRALQRLARLVEPRSRQLMIAYLFDEVFSAIDVDQFCDWPAAPPWHQRRPQRAVGGVQ